MFSIEVSNGSKVYRPVTETPVADKAIYAFIQSLDAIKANDSLRLVHAGRVMARKTPNSVFLVPEWRG